MKKITLLMVLIIGMQIHTFSQNFFTKNKSSIEVLKAKSVNNNSIDSLINSCIAEIKKDSIKNTIQQLQNFGTRYMLAPNHKDVALYLQNKFISLGYNNTVLDSFIMVTTLPNSSIIDTTMQYNVIATYTGNTNPNNVYIVGGHYDDITNVSPMNYAPGADDDASGIAAAIEIARVMKKTGYIPESTIKFVGFAAEELRAYSDVYGGSQHYLNDALNNNENIGFFITHDMIANNTAINNWKLNINYHITSGWTVQLANNICQNFTSLTPINNFYSINSGGDDIPFARVGIPALYFVENEWSPNWHKESDTIGSCNMEYCAEVTKVSVGMLIKASEKPLGIKNYFIINPANGHTLQPSWKASTENDLAGYKVYIGRNSAIYDTVFFTTDTSFTFNNLLTDTIYYIGVNVINNKGIESAIIEKSDAPGFVTFANGILIVRDSKGGIFTPTDQEVDDFYSQICDGFVHSQYDATSVNKITLSTIGQYSSILWHMNDDNWCPFSILKNHTDLLRNYLNLGGHILFTLYKPSEAFPPSDFKKGSFLYDYVNIAGISNNTSTRFCGAKSFSFNLDSLYVDSLKLYGLYNNHLRNIEIFSPSQNGDILYLYDSKYDSITTEGCFKNKPVAIENNGTVKNVITLSFPLYYIKTEEAKDFIFHVMHDKFFENYTKINETKSNNFDIIAYPNPASDYLVVEGIGLKKLSFTIYNIVGQVVITVNLDNNSSKINIASLNAGIYFIKINTADKSKTIKFIKR
ncbi:MAG: M20/M25/M40 family metallo-hydrolase [Bacteroidetes bacterium]|nr:M20/M25/M40 family metallo-hydrolase [Bacteroidota bacterium]